jgi:hypothetical protein
MKQIGMGHGHPESSLRRNRPNVRALPVSVFEDESAAGPKEHGSARYKYSNIAKSIRAAKQCELRVVTCDFPILRLFIVGDIGGIGHDDIDGPVQFRQDIRGVPDDEMDSPISVALDVAFGPRGSDR